MEKTNKAAYLYLQGKFEQSVWLYKEKQHFVAQLSPN